MFDRLRTRWRRKDRSTSVSNSSSVSERTKAPKLKLTVLLLKIKSEKYRTEMLKKLKSRKLLAAVVGTVIATVGEHLGLSPEVIQWVVTVLTGYIVGQGIADAGANGGSQGA